MTGSRWRLTVLVTVNPSIGAQYLAAGDRMRVSADVGMKICVALAVLLIAAWALGLLPGAFRPF